MNDTPPEAVPEENEDVRDAAYAFGYDPDEANVTADAFIRQYGLQETPELRRAMVKAYKVGFEDGTGCLYLPKPF